MVMQWFIRLVSGTVNASQETVRALGDILSGPVPFFNMAEGELQKITSQTNFIDFKEAKACSDKIEK